MLARLKALRAEDERRARRDRKASERALACRDHVRTGRQRGRLGRHLLPVVREVAQAQVALLHHERMLVRQHERERTGARLLQRRVRARRRAIHAHRRVERRVVPLLHVERHAARPHEEAIRAVAVEPERVDPRHARAERRVVERHAPAPVVDAVRHRAVEFQARLPPHVQESVLVQAHVVRAARGRRRDVDGGRTARAVLHLPAGRHAVPVVVDERAAVRDHDARLAATRLKRVNLAVGRDDPAVHDERRAREGAAHAVGVTDVQRGGIKYRVLPHEHLGARVVRGLPRAARDAEPVAFLLEDAVRQVQHGVRLRPIADEHHAAHVVRRARRTHHEAPLIDGDVRESAVRDGAGLRVPLDVTAERIRVLRALAELLPAGIRERERTGAGLDEAAVRLRKLAGERERGGGVRHVERVRAVVRRPEGEVARHGGVAARPVEPPFAHDERERCVVRVHEVRRGGRREDPRARPVLGHERT